MPIRESFPMTSDANTIVTVTGNIDPEELGVTTTHEHLIFDMSRAWYDEPDSSYERKRANEPVSMDTIGYIRQNMMSHKDNMIMDSFDEAADEISRFYRAGGDTIVDLTPKNTGGDPEQIRALSRATGVQIIHGTSFYTRAAHPERVDSMDIAAIEDEFVNDVTHGFGNTGVRAGIVGEIGISGTIHPAEEKVLRAGIRAALRTGASLNVHPPGGKPDMPPNNELDGSHARSRWALEIMDIIDEEGFPPDRVIMSHMDATLFEEIRYQKQLAERGAFLEYDLWGNEHYLQAYGDGYPSDEWRIEAVLELLDEGYTDQLLFAHDICFKVLRKKYGGFGYSHILENIVPRFHRRGVDREVTNQILTENARRALTFTDPD